MNRSSKTKGSYDRESHLERFDRVEITLDELLVEDCGAVESGVPV
jgi:hypothetical protein